MPTICRGLFVSLMLLWVSAAAGDSTNSAWFNRVWQTDEGLPDNYISAIVQSQDGYLWVATPAGLARFDGVRFTKFSYKLTDGSDDRGVQNLAIGRSGNLWIVPDRTPPTGVTTEFSAI